MNNPPKCLLSSSSKAGHELADDKPKKIVGYTEFFSWGNDSEGQLGHGLEDNSCVARRLELPKSLSFEVFISQVACGSHHSAFISKDGHVFSFGSNREG